MALAPRSHNVSAYGSANRTSWTLNWPSVQPGDLLVGVLMQLRAATNIYATGWAQASYNGGAGPSGHIVWTTAGHTGAANLTIGSPIGTQAQWRTWVIPAGEWNPMHAPEVHHFANNGVGPQMPYLTDLHTRWGSDEWPYVNGLFAQTAVAAERVSGAANVLPGATDYDWNGDIARPATSDLYMVSGRSANTYNPLQVYDPSYPNLAFAAIRWRSLSIIVRPKRPPTGVVVNAPTQAGATFTFRGAASNNPESYDWDWGDGKSDTNTVATRAHAYQWGTYTVTLTARNNKGTGQGSYVLTVPRPVIDTVTHTQADDRVTLTAQTSGIPAGTSATWVWDFGDGSGPVEASSVAERYYPPGDYTVTVYARTVIGDTAASVYALTVLPPAPTPTFIYVRTPGTYDVLFSDRSLFVETRQWSVDGADYGVGEVDYLHVFPGPGQYVVRLTASNAMGSNWTEQVVHITDEYTALDRPDGLTVALVLDGQDVTCEVMQASWTFGAGSDEGPLTVQRSGRLSVRLADPGRALDPWQHGARYGDAAAVGHNLFLYVGATGTLDPLSLVWRGWVGDTAHDGLTLSVDGYDSIGRLASTIAGQDGPQTRPQETLASRLVALLDIASWPTSLRDVVGGTGAEVRETTFAGQDIWTQLQRSVTGIGTLSVLPDGTIRYRDGWDTTDGDTVQIGDGPHGLADPVLPLAADGLTDGASVARVVNDAVVGNDLIGSTRVQDAASQTEHGLQSTNQTTDTVTVAARDAFASELVAAMAAPRLQVTAQTIIGPDVVSAAAGIRFGRPGRMKTASPPIGPDIDRDGLLILGGSWSMTRAVTRLSLAAAQPPGAPVLRQRVGLLSQTAAAYGRGGLFSGVIDHDHQGGILRPAAIEGGQSGAKVYQTQPQTLTNANFTVIVFDAVDRDDDGYYDPAYPTRLTAQRTGWHYLTAAYDAYNQDRVFSNFRLNGSTGFPQGRIQMGATRVGAMNATPVWLEAGWYIEWSLWTTDAGGDHKTYPSNEAGPVMSMVYM